MREGTIVAAAGLLALALAGCGGEKGAGEEPEGKAGGVTPQEKAGAPEKEARPEKEVARPSDGKRKRLLVTQSQFEPNDDGKYTVPDAAVMLVLTPAGDRWTVERIEDRESNVFHKALPYGDGILTIGAEKAMLKLWTKEGDAWGARTFWNPSFGGEHDRLRDFEIADFNGDGEDDLAIATHDQGVVAVAWHRGAGFEPVELQRKPDTFVHEIEVGDLDGDGKLEIYATPSEPNTVSGEKQGGRITRFAWNGDGFDESVVVSLENRHVKEILVADLEGDGRQELYAALEAEMGEGGKLLAPVEIRRFDEKGGAFESSKVVELKDRFCRFLLAGDVDRDGDNELVATAFSSGVWVVEREGEAYSATCIDPSSGGFEHASYLADVDGDGLVELYVADDRGGAIRRYLRSGDRWESKVINKRLVPGQAMVWNITTAEI